MEKWWKKAIGYQIYLRSFKDSNDDGIGDLQGIISKLDYLHDLGINLIWICPFYDSPMDDNGYDVRDFYKVSSEYGTMDDFKQLISKAHLLNIKVMTDLVLNHTSDEHYWFQEAKKDKNSKYHDYYIWGNPRYKDSKMIPPTNWASFFGGSCWEYNEETNEYYMKIFSKKMPDLNWNNKELRKEIQKVAKFWIELGVDGFRVDAVAHLGKCELVDSFDNYDKDKDIAYDWSRFSNLEIVHDYLHELNVEVFSKYDLACVGEVGGNATVEDAIRYTSVDSKELDMVFNFDHNWCNNGWNRKKGEELKINVHHIKEMFKKWQTRLQNNGWNAIYWLNHDQPRVASHYGSLEYPLESTKMLATIMYNMSGTPFIYNGEEIGMTSPKFNSIEDFNDVQLIGQYEFNVIKNKQDKDEFIFNAAYSSRDNARTMMQWDDSIYAGFSTHKPWYRVNDNYLDINVSKQLNDSNSLLNYYKKVIEIRLNSIYQDTLCYGTYQIVLEEDDYIYAYLREYKDETLLVVANLTKEECTIHNLDYKVCNVILHNYKTINSKDLDSLLNSTLRPFESYLLKVERMK